MSKHNSTRRFVASSRSQPFRQPRTSTVPRMGAYVTGHTPPVQHGDWNRQQRLAPPRK